MAVLVVVAATPIVLSITVGPPASTVAWVIFGVIGVILFGLPIRLR